jgi:hypothetical protein
MVYCNKKENQRQKKNKKKEKNTTTTYIQISSLCNVMYIFINIYSSILVLVFFKCITLITLFPHCSVTMNWWFFVSLFLFFCFVFFYRPDHCCKPLCLYHGTVLLGIMSSSLSELAAVTCKNWQLLYMPEYTANVHDQS